MTINDYDDFIKRLFFTTREMNTIIRNQLAPATTGSGFFTGAPADKVPRFDKIILNNKQIERAHSSSSQRLKKDRIAFNDTLSKMILDKK